MPDCTAAVITVSVPTVVTVIDNQGSLMANLPGYVFAGTTYTQIPGRTDANGQACQGDEFSYTYDAVGNRLSQTINSVTNNYTYDAANRLTSVDSVTYTWDNNGNLLSDGTNTYTYTSNKLSSISGENLNVTFQYNGLGDRLSQTVNGVTTNYTLDLNSGLTQVLNDGTNTYVYGMDRITQMNGTTPEYFLADGLGSVRQLVNSAGNVTLAKSYQPYGTEISSVGNSLSSYGFTGEMSDPTGLIYLRARFLSPTDGRFLTKDLWMGDYNRPLSLNRWAYTLGNPVNYTDPSGYISVKNTSLDCPFGGWDCEAVENVATMKQAFIASASRHNKIPNMDDNGFAALIAATIVSERRVGNIPPDGDPRDRSTQTKENIIARFGCIVSGNFIKPAWDNQEWLQFLRYLLNIDIPEGDPLLTLASVGIGNVKLVTAANLLKGKACDYFGECTSVQVSPLKTTNVFGWTIDIQNPFDSQLVCSMGSCASYQPSEVESLSKLTLQLLNDEMNIEYVAANLEAGALRMIAKGLQPTAYSSATWHLRGVQTPAEISALGWWDPGGAEWILNAIPTALKVLDLDSSWNISQEMQFIIEANNAFRK